MVLNCRPRGVERSGTQQRWVTASWLSLAGTDSIIPWAVGWVLSLHAGGMLGYPNLTASMAGPRHRVGPLECDPDAKCWWYTCVNLTKHNLEMLFYAFRYIMR